MFRMYHERGKVSLQTAQVTEGEFMARTKIPKELRKISRTVWFSPKSIEILDGLNSGERSKYIDGLVTGHKLVDYELMGDVVEERIRNVLNKYLTKKEMKEVLDGFDKD